MKWKLEDLQEKFWTKKRMVPTNIVKTAEQARESLRSANVPGNFVSSLEIPVSAEGGTTEIGPVMGKAKAHIVELKPVRTLAIHQNKMLLDDIKQCHAEKGCVLNDVSAENANSVNFDENVAEVDSVKIVVIKILILACFNEHLCAYRRFGKRQRRSTSDSRLLHGGDEGATL